MKRIEKFEREELTRILEKRFASDRLGDTIPIALNEAFEKLDEHEKEISIPLDPEHRRNYLLKAGRDAILNEIRRRKNLDSLDDQSRHFENDPGLSDNLFEEQEMSKLLSEEMLGSLSIKKRKTMELHIEGYSVNEIAEKLEISPNAVKRRLKEARKKLRKFFGKDGTI